MLIDELGSKVKCHVYVITNGVDDHVQAVCENEQFARDMIARSRSNMTMKVWAVWGYRGDYNPPIPETGTVNYNG